MSKAHMPPLPPAARSPHGGADHHVETGEAKDPKSNAAARDVNVEQQGQTANTLQNTNNQGRQQDR
jgi:hypothetical protein